MKNTFSLTWIELFSLKKIIIKHLLHIFIFLSSLESYAQLSFCSGNYGDPIFTETFGSGLSNGPELSLGTTSYIYTSNSSPIDGYYTISNSTNAFGWDLTEDHTPNDTNGKCLIVNASYTAGEFYETTIDGLCENTTYEFSAWVKNILPYTTSCPSGGIPINIKFEIRDVTKANLLGSGDTGDIGGVANQTWNQYGLVFQTLPGQNSIVLRMLNNGVGGCGNDLAIDDIVFKTCGDGVIINDSYSNNSIIICEDELPYSTELKATPDFAIFSSHFYQWQESTNGVSWSNIIGENNAIYNVSSITETTFFRVKISEDEINLNNNSCNSTSEIFIVETIPFPVPPMSNGDLYLCADSTIPLKVTSPTSNTGVNWYDSPIGGNLLLSNNLTYLPNTSGTYYAETISSLTSCLSQSRTPIAMTYLEVPIAQNESYTFCEGETILINANVTNSSIVTSYLWSNGQTGQEITVSEPGEYVVEIFNNDCSIEKSITVNQIELPIIKKITSIEKNIIISTSNSENTEYSLDGVTFQSSNTFYNIDGDLYMIYAKNINCETTVTGEYIHFPITKFFTPNEDGVNDVFELKGIENFSNYSVAIFDRFGKMIKQSFNIPFTWDGKFQNSNLASDEYWYIITINEKELCGHFSLIR